MSRFSPFRSGNELTVASPMMEERVSVGALVFTSIAEMTERGRPTNEGIQALDRDIRNTLVYVEPEQARESAKKARAQADAIEGTIPKSAAVLREIATKLDNDASVNEVRMKGLPPEQVKRQLSYSASFFTFNANWNEFYKSVRNGDVFDSFSGNEVAAMIDSYDAQYRTFVDGYKKLGFEPATPPPPKSDAGDTLPNVNANVKGFFDSIPWGTLAVVGVVGVGGYVAFKLLSESKDSPSVTVVNTPTKES